MPQATQRSVPQGVSGGVRDREIEFVRQLFWDVDPFSLSDPSVPTAPKNWNVDTCSVAASSSSIFHSLSNQLAAFNPNVIGTACTWWVRPIIGV